MSSISTLSDLIKQAGCQYRLYDVGRMVTKITKQDFEKIEHNQMPYPYPIQGHAWLAIVFWQVPITEPYIWFAKFPLDERGLLNLGARNHFIGIIIEALGEQISGEVSQEQQAILDKNPYHFTPSQYKMASLHALINDSLKRPASSFYPAVQQYFAEQNYQNWQALGAQGIADFSTRLTDDDNLVNLQASLADLPEQVLAPLVAGLENQVLPLALIEQCCNLALHHPTHNSLYLRALASSSEHSFVHQLVQELLPKSSDDLMILIAGRLWLTLADDNRMMAYLTRLAEHHAPLFSALFADLVAIPAIRPYVFSCMRAEQKSDALAEQIGLLFQAQQPK